VVGGAITDGRGWLMPRGVRRRPRFLATKLREIRDGLGLSQDGIIERLGLANYIDRGKISDFERGVREPDLLTLKAYADEAGVSVDDLIDDDAKLPRKLPGAKQTKEPVAMTTTTVSLQLQIKSDGNVSREESGARVAIEKAHLKRYGIKKLKDGEYELTFSHQDEADLDEQIYTLLREIKREARAHKCSVKASVREKHADRYW
jgi:transcriptional regulator with XRE-family HTH domain